MFSIGSSVTLPFFITGLLTDDANFNPKIAHTPSSANEVIIDHWLDMFNIFSVELAK